MTGLVGGRETPERRAGGHAGLGFDRTGLSWSQDGGREADVWPELRAQLTGTVAGRKHKAPGSGCKALALLAQQAAVGPLSPQLPPSPQGQAELGVG